MEQSNKCQGVIEGCQILSAKCKIQHGQYQKWMGQNNIQFFTQVLRKYLDVYKTCGINEPIL